MRPLSREAKKKDSSNEFLKSPQSEILTMQEQMIPRKRKKKVTKEESDCKEMSLGSLGT